MTAMISLNKLQSSPNVNVNVKPSVNVSVGAVPTASAAEGLEVENNVIYPDPEASVKYTEYRKLKSENEVLKIIIDMLRNNPLMYNGYVIADDEKLMKLIQLLTNADDVQIEADDIGEGCFTTRTYRKIHTIYIITNGTTQNLKYNFPGIMKELTDLGISVKYVW
jgi:hypothetical protein